MTTSTSDQTIVSRQTALMLMDFQPAILSRIPHRDALMESVRVALGWAREHGVKVVFVRVAFAPEDYDAIPHHHKAFGPAKQGRLFADGDPALEVDPALAVRDGDIVVRKTRYGAFSTTDLHALFGDESIDTLVVGGISTAGVVLSTVREASDQDYRIFVLADATDDPDPEVHRVLIAKVLPRQADVITTADLNALVRNVRPASAVVDG
ncbi:isochorismatase [Planotetraspora silvatica]|uniref:Isochorismatase n=1 Tax=Planotetraspora silvatica TaxID=234614 RepID=A0A8J3XRN7_9ACTN|nr:isochorismatase family cysteine hydrolase [Planotetraspora silvatica]GII50509.1 isochorismatase [Planotetraspora silvatica]